MFIGDMIDLDEKQRRDMSLSLAHGLGRFKIKFSSDKVDIMIIQAVNLHEDLDKEINNYMMRLKEWYGYHFPELTKIIEDSTQYCQLVNLIGHRENSQKTDLSEIVDEEQQRRIREMAEISMGAEVTDQDIQFIKGLSVQILELLEQRKELERYLVSRM